MRPMRLPILVVVGLCVTVAFGQAAALRLGDTGQQVLMLQENLARLGFFQVSPTGYYGRLTYQAVKGFQISAGLSPDGVAGEKTLAAIELALARLGDRVSSRDGDGTVAMLAWNLVNQIWPRGTTARVYDIDSGRSFVAWRLYGSLHADVEPLTKHDTSMLKQIYGGRWSWDRHAVIVELGGRYIAASMNGMPHGHQAIYDNDFPGQFCLHFLGSRLHKNRRVDAVHQAMVLKAAKFGLNGLVRPAVTEASDAPPGDEGERPAAPAGTAEDE